LEQVVVIGAAQQQDRLALVLPVERVLCVRLDPVGVVGVSGSAYASYCQRSDQGYVRIHQWLRFVGLFCDGINARIAGTLLLLRLSHRFEIEHGV
jgi:hypothetical protein